MFTLAHLSDPHLPPLQRPRWSELADKRGLAYVNWLRKRRAVHRTDVLAAIMADLAAHAPDHVALTGDVINLSLASEFGAAREWLDRIGGPDRLTLIPGNHDAYVRATADHGAYAWGAYMQGDAGEPFPFLRRRGPLALIGLTSALPTLPLAATGRLGEAQVAGLADLLQRLGGEGLFRVVLVHHPPRTTLVDHFRRLVDAAALRAVLKRHGAELVLHGHQHMHTLAWLDGPAGAIPAVGVPSASGSPHRGEDPAGYNLYEIGGRPGAWRCTAIARGLSRNGAGVGETSRRVLLG